MRFFFISLLISVININGQTNAATIFKKYNNAVVKIITYKNGLQENQASGVVLKKKGWIVTNYHVLRNSDYVTVEHNGTVYPLMDSLVAFDSKKDILILMLGLNIDKKIFGAIPDLKTARFNQLEIGQEVFAIGSPYNFENTITNGLLSGIRTTNDSTQNLLQISAPISSGSSGGAVFNAKGELIGISTALIAGDKAQNLNFAVSIDDIFASVKKGISETSIIQTREDAKTYYYEGARLFFIGKFAEALTNFKKSLRLTANDKEVIYGSIGECFLNLRKADSACFYFAKSNMEKENVNAFMGIAKGRLMMGDTIAAQTMLMLAAKISGKNIDPQVGLAEINILKGEYKTAFDTLKSAFTINPNHLRCKILLGYVALNYNMTPQATLFFDSALGLDPENPLALLGKSRVLRNKKDLQLANEYEKKALQLEPTLKYSKYYTIVHEN